MAKSPLVFDKACEGYVIRVACFLFINRILTQGLIRYLECLPINWIKDGVVIIYIKNKYYISIYIPAQLLSVYIYSIIIFPQNNVQLTKFYILPAVNNSPEELVAVCIHYAQYQSNYAPMCTYGLINRGSIRSLDAPRVQGPSAQPPHYWSCTKASKRISQALPEGLDDTLGCTGSAKVGVSAPLSLSFSISLSVLWDLIISM